MSPDIVIQRIRLQVLDVLDAVSDASRTPAIVELGLEHLIEDWCIPNEGPPGEWLDRCLLNDGERGAARVALPHLNAAYMTWEWSDNRTWLHNRPDADLIRQVASEFALQMRRNEAGQSVAQRERMEATK